MKSKLKKSLSMLLVLCMLFSAFSTSITAFAEDTTTQTTPKVEIVSFMRGAQKDLRSSELLEARLTGYDGNVRELTYKWENSLGTYLYVYNSHNMYYIEGTDGEVEIYNSKIEASNNMSGRTYKDSFTGTGYCWAAIYGSNTSGRGTSIADNNAYNGTIKVTVYDKDGKEIATDSHTGTVTSSGILWWQTYYYNGIVDFNLTNDIDNVTIGLFENDERNMKDLLGESAILHITCVESSVTSGKIVSGNNHISLTTRNGDYYIKGLLAGDSTDSDGDAQAQVSITKNQCKFHEYVSGTATTTVYVFKKPTTSTTAYTLSLVDNLDSRCRYFIDGREGVKQADGTILFEGLNPNTNYMVEVRGEYTDENKNTKYAYAYVYDTTKPIYNGTVEVYLDGTYDSATHTATGKKVNLEQVCEYSTLYAKQVDGIEFIKLEKKPDTTGTYTNILDSGSYKLYYTNDESTKIDDQLLVMHNADRTRYLFYNSVIYKDADTTLNTEYHLTGSSVPVWSDIPTKDGYVFTGWKDQDGKIYHSTDTLTQNIATPYVLTAQWAKTTDIYVNVKIHHVAENGIDSNHQDNMHNVTFELIKRAVGSQGDYESGGFKTIKWDGKSEFDVDGYTAELVHDDETDQHTTTYTATAPTFKDALADLEYSLDSTKPGYSIVGTPQTIVEDDRITINLELIYEPSKFDFNFSVELDEEAKKLPEKFKPVAANVKVITYYDSPLIDGEDKNWATISQLKDTYLKVSLDENGEGSGTYPVWQDDHGDLYFYRIEVVSYELADGTIIQAYDGTKIPDSHVTVEHTEYCTLDKRYHAGIHVTDGYSPDGTDLYGAYYENNGQQGTVKAVISIHTHTVTFKPNGGEFSDGTSIDKYALNQITIPNLDDYTVTRDGGYVFDGWYVYENGKMTDITVHSGDELYDDITLIAKWRDPLTIRGIVSVAGYYHLNGNTEEIRIINQVDRTHYITVYLQKLLPNGYTETISTQRVPVAYNDMTMEDIEKPMGTTNYQFTAIENDGTQYRVLIQNPNYIVTYQHEDESIDYNKMFDYENYYNNLDFMAEFGDSEPLVADVNAFMEFEPHDFALHYAVSAANIGEGFRPSTTDIYILYDDGQSGNHPQDWPVITQMVDGDNIIGQDTDINSSGQGSNSYKVWRNKPDGHSLYDFAVLLNSYTINGTQSAYNANTAPFYTYYNGSARYSALEGLTPEHQTQLLTIELQPKRYTVTFDVDFTETQEDHVENMASYFVLSGDSYSYQTGHIWSYDTDISGVVPTRKGYKFLGWYDENDNLVTNIDASVCENVTVIAKWEKAFKVTFHANNDDISYDVFRTYYENGVEVSDENAFFLKADGSLDSFYDIPEFEYYTHNNYVFKGWYLDEVDDSRPINWKEKYTEDTDVYAHWILVEDVEKEEADTKLYDNSGRYTGYDLLGVQIRDIEKENNDHYGKEGTGLRFVTVLSEDVYSQINELSNANKNGAEYGYALAKTDTAKKYAIGEAYTLQYKGTNVNGKDTTTDYKYVSNVKCSGVPDHFNGQEYRLYTAVVTFNNLTDEALANAHASSLVARSYIRYTDANGLLRTHYNNYTGTNTYSGCSASFDLAKALMNG